MVPGLWPARQRSMTHQQKTGSAGKNHIPGLLKLAGPMILSASTITMMQIVDTIILSHYSSQAIAAIGPSSMAVILFQGFLFGTTGYAGTFVAHNHGRGNSQGVLSSAWLGIYSALASGFIALALAWPVAQLFLLAGHEQQVALDERSYFLICMLGSFFPVFGAAMAGWLSGIGRPAVVTVITLISFAVNALLTWGMVLGEWGFPRMGISGAALATVVAQLVAAALYAAVFARAGGFGNRLARVFELTEFRRFLSLAMPMGFRISGELLAWTLFLVVVGRLGMVELAASSIAFRINGTAFFPALGLGQAAGILVGHARGAGRDDEVPGIAWQSLIICEVWMLVMAVLFAVASAPLMGLFAGSGPEAPQIVAVGALLMKFVAVYCVLDAANVVLGCVLAAAGETRWIARTFAICTGLFLLLLWLIDWLMPSLVLEWTLATLFVCCTALIWAVRFRSGRWRNKQLLRGA